MRHLMKAATLVLASGVLIAGCAQERLTDPHSEAQTANRGGAPGYELMRGSAAMETITFEGLPAGTILSEVYGDLGGGPVAVNGVNPILGAVNATIVFDTANPTGGDDDLGTPNETFGGPGVGAGGEAGQPYENDMAMGEALIIAQNLTDANDDDLVDDPNDTAVDGAEFHFDFSAVGEGSVEIHSMALIDVENTEDEALVQFFDGSDLLISQSSLPQTGDNGLEFYDFGGVLGVVRMVVTLGGSGAIDNIVFATADEPELGEIGDYVWCDVNDDGVQDADEPAIAGVTVSLRCAGPDGDLNTGDDILDSMQTNADGLYLFTEIPAGMCVVSVEPTAVDGKVPGTNCPTTHEVDLGEGESYLDADFCFVYPPDDGGEGCTPGYWKTHPGAWDDTAYAPGDLVKSVWPSAEAYVGDATLLEALDFGGGPGATGAARILLRAATASLLNASNTNVSFDLAVTTIIDEGDLALASGDRGTMLELATALDGLNNSGCPIGRDGELEGEDDGEGVVLSTQ